MTGPHVGPADEGTGVPQGDEADVDAANVAAYVDNPNARDFVVDGLQLQNIDYATPQVDLTAGKARLHAASAQTESGGTNDAETRDHVTFVGEWTARTGLSLTDGATNRIWIYMDLSTSNGELVRVDTAASPNVPPEPRVQVAEIDTGADTAVELARNPDANFGATTHDSVQTGALTDSEDGSSWETLREMGYETGDVVPITSFTGYTQTASTTSTTFTNVNALGSHRFVPDIIGPASKLKVGLSVELFSNTGETPTGRFVDFAVGTEVISATAATGSTDRIWTGWEDYTSADPGTVRLFLYQHKTDNGDNSISSRAPILSFGVEI